MNRVTLWGHLGGAPVLRHTDTGNAVLSFSMATSEYWFDEQNTKHEHTEWHRCAVWGPRAERLIRQLRSGSQVLVEGRLRTTSYEREAGRDEQGQTVKVRVWTTEVKVTSLSLCGKAPARADESTPEAQAATRNAQPPPASTRPDDDDDIPL